ncbi:hypothetical protein Tco_0988085, partial [Tanacetum coccineum]
WTIQTLLWKSTEEEKARKHEKVFNWQTATYRKIRIDDDLHNLSSVEAEFPTIIVNDDFAPQNTLQCKSQVSTPVIDEIDFRISFDESDDKDYTIICDKNSFSYEMISINDLKMDSESASEKVMPSIQSPKSAINMALPPREQRHMFLRYEGLEYTDYDITDFEARLARIHMREVHRVNLFLGLASLITVALLEESSLKKVTKTICLSEGMRRLARTTFLILFDESLMITWALVAMWTREGKPDAAAGALVEAEDVLIVDEVGQADPAPAQAPQQPPPPPPAPARTIP